MLVLSHLLALAVRLINVQQFDEQYMSKVLLTRLQPERATATPTDSTCLVASRHHAQYMAAAQEIGHYEKKSYGSLKPLYSVTERNVDAEICLSYQNFSENNTLSYKQLADSMAVNWLRSPDHKLVLKNKQLTCMGAAVVYRPDSGTFYAVVNFRY